MSAGTGRDAITTRILAVLAARRTLITETIKQVLVVAVVGGIHQSAFVLSDLEGPERECDVSGSVRDRDSESASGSPLCPPAALNRSVDHSNGSH
ncbi:hypothetical protein LSAT2_013653, partial [Lamellibrachia satsuma]